MTRIQMIILWALTLIAGAIVFATNSKDDENNEETKTKLEQGTEIFADVDLRKVAGLKMSDASKSATVSIKDDSWGVVESDHFPADLQKVRSAFDKLTKLKVMQGIPATAEYWERFGLNSEAEKTEDRPREIIVMNESGETVTSIFIGKQRDNTGGLGGQAAGRFVRFGGDDSGVYVVNEDFFFFDGTAENWIKKDFITTSRPLKVSIIAKEGESWEVTRAKKSDPFTLTGLAEDRVDIAENTDALKQLFNGGRFNDLLTEEEAKAKRDGGEELTVSITTADRAVYDFTLWPEKPASAGDDEKKEEDTRNYIVNFQLTSDPKPPVEPGEKATEEEKTAFQAAMINFKSAPIRAAKNKKLAGRYFLLPNSSVKALLVKKDTLSKAKPKPKPVTPPKPAPTEEAAAPAKPKVTAVTKPIAVPPLPVKPEAKAIQPKTNDTPIPGTPLDPSKRIEAVTPPITIPPAPKKPEESPEEPKESAE